ncbi:MAG: thiamine pyrophosphate-dependent dehydrogenase E1 component subunit alpha [Firmicutes bacterium]|jgi:pyruvate dehydrogenase E1 component alpha subunit|nr:thiamine pyrophosphate-dependent dehydrogenase E1 component subunit alpha [Bacillota bacterium]
MVDPEFQVEMLRKMMLIRGFEERVRDLYASGYMAGLAHLYIGEEAVAVGVCSALDQTDFITSTHRGHGHCIAKGGDVRKMMAEVMGRSTGYCKGKGGSMHIFDVKLGILGANGIVAGGIPMATGAALASKLKGSRQVTACFFGDGATNQGTFHESLNMAGLWKLPVVYVCENNLYGISVSQTRHQAIKDVAVRASSYGMPGVTVDGNDVLAVYDAAKEAVERARSGGGPTLLECKTYRHGGHHCGEPGTAYRPQDEIAAWKNADPITRMVDRLISSGILEPKDVREIQGAVDSLLLEAVEYAKGSPLPAPEEALEDLYSGGQGVL